MREVPEQDSSWIPHLLGLLGAGWIRSLAKGKQLPLAHPTLAAGDRERHDDAFADLELGVTLTDFNDLAHGLVPKHVVGVHF